MQRPRTKKNRQPKHWSHLKDRHRMFTHIRIDASTEELKPFVQPFIEAWFVHPERIEIKELRFINYDNQ